MRRSNQPHCLKNRRRKALQRLKAQVAKIAVPISGRQARRMEKDQEVRPISNNQRLKEIQTLEERTK